MGKTGLGRLIAGLALAPLAALEAQVVNQKRQHVLNSRIIIEQAKGMVAEREGPNMEQAFTALRSHARNHNLRLVVLAEDLIGGSLAASALDPVPRAEPA
jgi:AmiR/NasT family two-component response regulator